jgi:hypothetical protein
VYPSGLWGKALRRCAVDGVFIARSDGHDFKGVVVQLPVDEPEALRPLTGYVELDPSETGQVAADVSLAELFADDPSTQGRRLSRRPRRRPLFRR